MSYLNTILTDLREKRLWPIALVLLAALVAVPVLLSSSAKPAAVAHADATPPPSSATALPAVSVSSQPDQSRLHGKSRDPFTQMLGGATVAAAGAATSSTGSSAAPVTGSASPTVGGPTSGAGASINPATAVGGSSGSSGSTAGGAQVSPPTGASSTPVLPTRPKKPAPAGLTATQSYDVALAISNSSGGFDTTDPLERLSVIPSTQDPRLVELGVLRGGRRVLFAVQPGTSVSGPGSCVPSPMDCEILTLAEGRTERLSKRTPDGMKPVALFAVTGIMAQRHSSVAAASAARRAASPAGSRLLAASSTPVLSLFQYNPGLGAVVDLRNLTIGGNAASMTQALTVLGGTGGGGTGGGTGAGGSPPPPAKPGLRVRIQLMPQGLRAMLRSGLAVRVSSNEPAAGVAMLSIPRGAARRAHIRGGSGPFVVIGRGTVAQVKDGTVMLRLHLHLSRSTRARLLRLRHVAVTVRMVLRAGDGGHVAVDAAARY